MEGNPVWSNPNYANQLVISLPSLVKLDQQDVTQVLLNAEVTLIKKIIKFSSYIRKFRVEQLQSHI
jgi:hypothetical protein